MKMKIHVRCQIKNEKEEKDHEWKDNIWKVKISGKTHTKD